MSARVRPLCPIGGRYYVIWTTLANCARQREFSRLHTIFTVTAGHLHVGFSTVTAMSEGRARILIVEDEVDIAAAIAERLSGSGFEIAVAHDGAEGLSVARSFRPDLVILDLMLPLVPGYEVCASLQAESQTPVLMLTALDDETDMLVGLRLGADDYMTKPFSMRELVARVEAILRRVRRSSERSSAHTLGSLAIDEPKRQVFRGGEEVHLTPTEFNLLIELLKAEGEVLSRAELLRRAWGYDDDAGARTVDSHIRAIRRKLGDDVVRTVHGVGYGVAVAPEDAS